MKGVTATALAEEIGDRLKQARLYRNLTQSEVAEFGGIARQSGREPEGIQKLHLPKKTV